MDRDNNHKDRCRYFRKKLYKMVDDPSTNSIVSWSNNGNSFIIWNESEFCRDVLPIFSHYKEMAPFIRRLGNMGFKKIESEELEYGSDDFVRGHPEPELSPEAVRARLKELALASRKELCGSKTLRSDV
ncbi:Heat shock factor (HSF)-type DNA-binding [Arabidopsis thaliana x Arabidopsis arenosa]|uniref:Heat shock factor (HSF)-type DNA-binding n=1 Tax=Arabidopsis thaliana x Arabidopsis arenosa TaxID=1240361 RepID=A0A8T1XK77_9BRAS|nr:Heat shock factor (HSF)-type DNA-binding [Arabidopsis thaliana x Arabidopsis arenosa]